MELCFTAISRRITKKAHNELEADSCSVGSAEATGGNFLFEKFELRLKLRELRNVAMRQWRSTMAQKLISTNWLGVWCISLAEAMLRTSHKYAIIAFSPLQFNFGGGQYCGWRLLSRKTAIIQEHMSQAAVRISNAEAEKNSHLGNAPLMRFAVGRRQFPVAIIPTPTHQTSAVPSLPPPFPPRFPSSTTSPPSGYFFFSCPRLNKYQVRPADLLPTQHN